MEILEIEDPKWGLIELKHWTNLHFREAADLPMDIILIQRKGMKLSADAAKPIWLACQLEQMLPLQQFWPLYQRRFNIDHWNRSHFAKITLDFTQTFNSRTRAIWSRFDASTDLAVMAGS